MTRKAKDYGALAAKAEKAVATVNDPELRRVAFDRVLQDLLEEAETRDEPDQPKKSAPKGSKNTPKARRHGPQGHVEELAEEGFFKQQKTIADVRTELSNRGHHIPITSLSGPLQKLCQRKVLRRQRLKTGGKRETFVYSNW